MPRSDNPVLQRAMEYFGDVSGRTVLDLGCGRGATSLYFASRGAQVISVDASAVAIANLTAYCETHSLTNIRPVHLPAQRLSELEPVDLVFGSLILHHIEPFADFVTQLRAVLRPGGRAFFFENSAKSRTLIWFRQHVVGKLWVPKNGDPDEFPLTPAEVDALREQFDVSVEIPYLHFFRLIPTYLLRRRFESPFVRLDDFCYRFKPLRPLSYRQQLLLS